MSNESKVDKMNDPTFEALIYQIRRSVINNLDRISEFLDKEVDALPELKSDNITQGTKDLLIDGITQTCNYYLELIRIIKDCLDKNLSYLLTDRGLKGIESEYNPNDA